MSLDRLFVPNKTAFMPYVCCGDPNVEFTLKLVAALAENGAGAIELGIPFSDPIADGSTIQAASQRSLANGMTPKKAIETISRIRKSGIMIPIIVMTYYNIIFANGLPGFIKKIKDVGADGLVVPDVPLEEANELDNICKEQGITLAYFITPNMSEERIKKITDKASGFLYAVSVIGTTGTRPHVALEAIELVKRAKKLTKIPVVAGFGISTPEQAAEFASAGANGVIAGSKFVEIYSKHIIDEELNEENALDEVKKFVEEMARAIATPPSLSL